MKPGTLPAQTSGEKHLQKVRVHVCSTLKSVELFCPMQNGPVCWAQGRISPSFFFLGSVMSATTWQECWQVPVLAMLFFWGQLMGQDSCSGESPARRSHLLARCTHGDGAQHLPSQPKGPLGTVLLSHSPSSGCPRWEPAPASLSVLSPFQPSRTDMVGCSALHLSLAWNQVLKSSVAHCTKNTPWFSVSCKNVCFWLL